MAKCGQVHNPLTMEEKGKLKGWANAQYAISMRYKDADPAKSEFYHGRSVAAGKIASTYNPGDIQARKSGMKVYCSICGKMILTKFYLYEKGEFYHLYCYRGKLPGEKNPTLSKDPWNITLGQVENAIAYAWRCFDRYEKHNDPYDKKGTELYLKYQKAKEIAEGLRFHAPWLYPTKLPNPTLVMPIKSKKQLGHMFKAQSQLAKAGVTFDSGTSIRNERPTEREWELDWSLKGGYMRNPLGKRQKEVLDLMQSGWELGETEGFSPDAWLQKGGIGRGGERKDVSMNLLISLYKKDLIEVRAKKYPFVYYKLRTSNPIRHTKKGWYWGSVGPQPTKAKLLNQVRAIYAGGYKDKNPSKTRLPDTARCIKCKRTFSLSVLRERPDYVPAICPLCGGALRSVYEKKPPGLYQSFHGNPPKGTRKVNYQPPPKKLIKVGRITQIRYRPEYPSKHEGTEFYHNMGDTGEKKLKSNAILATDPKGKWIYIVKDKDTKHPFFSSRGVIG